MAGWLPPSSIPAMNSRPSTYEQAELTAGVYKLSVIRSAGFLARLRLLMARRVSSRLSNSPHVSTRQYARIVHQWVAVVGLDSTVYGTHTMRRTKATLIYKRTKNLRAVQLLLGHSKLESTVHP